MKILVTCPPMLGLMAEFAPLFAARGFTLEAPAVVQTLSADELMRRLPGCSGWIAGDDAATREVLTAARAGSLRALVKWGIGIDNIDLAALADLGIRFINTPHMFGNEVADYAMAYVTGLAREMHVVDRGVRAGAWPKPVGMSLAQKQVGLIGFGNIGQATARRLLAADMRLLVYDPALGGTKSGEGWRAAQWPTGVETCDFLVFTCALTATNRHMFDAAVLARCKDGVRIVNVARGPLLDTQALLAGLRSGRIHSAALDVFEDEPLPAASELRAFERVIFGSHNASNTVEAVRRTSLRAIDAIADMLSDAGD